MKVPNKWKQTSKRALVPLANMHVCEAAQRRFQEGWAREILSQFDPDKMALPVVSHRDDRYYIVDGQHTIWAVKAWIGDDWETQKVECVVHEGLTEKDEARMFIALNNKRSVAPYDKFMAGVTGQLEEEMNIARVVTSAGLTISRSRRDADAAISAVTTLRRVYAKYGPQTLKRSLVIIRDSFGSSGFEAAVIEGVADIYNRYNGALSDEVTIEAMKKIYGGITGLVSEAVAMRKACGGTMPHSVASVLVTKINRLRKGKRLPAWSIHDDDVVPTVPQAKPAQRAKPKEKKGDQRSHSLLT